MMKVLVRFFIIASLVGVRALSYAGPGKNNNVITEENADRKKAISLHTFGKDMVASIFSYLAPKEVANLRSVSQEWDDFIQSKDFLDAFRITPLASTKL